MASLRDTLANLVEQYKASDTPMANLMRGDTEGAKQSVANALQQATQDPYSGLNVLGTTKLVGKTAQELAHATAQKNAVEMLGLPEGNTAMDRAKALGFNVDEPVYHGTSESYNQIDPSKLGFATQSLSAKKAFWGVKDSSTAGGYANYASMDAKVQKLIDDSELAERKNQYSLAESLMNKASNLENEFANNPNQGQNIMPLIIKNTKQAHLDAGGNTFMDMQDEMHNLLNDAIENKYPSVKISNLSDEIDYGRHNPTTHYGALDPSVVRSRFAAFDPARTNEPDLLAGAMAIPIATDKDKRNKMIELLKNK